jgi:hypothetical protein
MMLKTLSQKALSARRTNAQKSTGPRTPAGKARVSKNLQSLSAGVGRSGSLAQTLRTSMLELGEDPAEFLSIHKGLRESFMPATPAEDMLLEDVTQLRWERRRLERAQCALVARRVQELELERQRHSLEISQKIHAAIPASMMKMGMIWEVDSATKFQKLLEMLEGLKGRVEVGEFSDFETVWRWIYGPNPSVRGAMIRALFLEQAESNGKGKPERGDDHPQVDPAGTSALRREILGEISNVTQQYQLYIRKHTELTPTMREECLVPTSEQRWLTRQMNSIDRQIERKTLLLLAIQKVRLQQEIQREQEPRRLQGSQLQMGTEERSRFLTTPKAECVENKEDSGNRAPFGSAANLNVIENK